MHRRTKLPKMNAMGTVLMKKIHITGNRLKHAKTYGKQLPRRTLLHSSHSQRMKCCTERTGKPWEPGILTPEARNIKEHHIIMNVCTYSVRAAKVPFSF